MRVTVLGTRGSVPVSGSRYEEFGCATSCYLVEAGEQAVILDAGTGIVNAPRSFATPPAILISHPHLDHLAGLAMYGRLSIPEAETRLYVAGPKREAREALERLYAPPLWPLSLAQYPGNLVIDAMPDTLDVGGIAVDCIEGSHPGGCGVFKLAHDGKTLVYATDFEYEPAAFERLAAFARGADLILFEAQYGDEELEAFKGFGHSSPRIGLRLMERTGARRMLLIHHDPRSDDQTLMQRERGLGMANVRFAREGEVVEL